MVWHVLAIEAVVFVGMFISLIGEVERALSKW